MDFLLVALVWSLLYYPAFALNIILNNDDGFATAHIRELYKALNDAGHNAWIVAPVSDQSGQGGRVSFTTNANLTAPGQFNSVPKGAPSYGTDPNDNHIWYYDGTPVACTFFALDFVVPNYWRGAKPDLVVGGPNFGNNAGPFMYTLSGTIAAAYAAVERGVPAVAFSAGNGPARSYQSVNQNTASGFPDPATILANLSTKLVTQMAGKANGSQLLPPGYGINVNYPTISSTTDDSCIQPPFIHTRMTGGASANQAVFDPSTGIFHTANSPPSSGINTCINGDCSLPGESTVQGNCQTSVSIFTVDYDAPNGTARQAAEQVMGGLVTSEADAKNYTAGSQQPPPAVSGSSSTSATASTASPSQALAVPTSDFSMFGMTLGILFALMVSER
ncbi:survival protein sure-like phosphatase/nucleotidase [Cryomyces antarcticus]|nr:hypothetical protein LTR60_002183 [Cryomyces antarcticus]